MAQKRKQRSDKNKPAEAFRKHYHAVLVVLVWFVLQTVAFYYYFVLPISLNGRPVKARRGETIQQMLDRKGVKLSKGDLVSIKGKVLEKKTGGPPLIEVNQQKAGPDYLVKGDDSIFVSRGADIKEKVTSAIELISPVTVFEGEGPFITLATKGQPGFKLTSRGKISREIAKEKIIRPAQPTVIRRTTVAPDLVVALTFDDGPDPIYTPQILSVLQNEGAVATFFILGWRAQFYPDLVRQELALGNRIGNHSFHHPDLGHSSPSVIEQELASTEAIISQISGQNSQLFRPPKGSISSTLNAIVAAKGYRLVLWDVDPWDWSRPSTEAIYQRVVSQVKPGAIILLHDGGGDRSQTVSALPMIIEFLRSQGYYFATLDQLPAK